MKDFEKNYKNMINKIKTSKIKLSSNDADEIKNSILNSKDKSTFKLKYAFIILIAFIIGSTVVYGEDLINLYKEYFVKKVTYKNEDGSTNTQYEGYFRDFVEIPNPNPYSDDDIGKYFTYEEIEETLGIKILRNPKIEENSFELFKLEYDDKNQVARICFNRYPPNLLGTGAGEIGYSFSLSTQYATEEQREEANLKVGELRKPVMYHIESLDTDAYIIAITMEGVDTNYYMTYAHSSFPYDGILYGVELEKFGYKIEDFYPILESLSY